MGLPLLAGAVKAGSSTFFTHHSHTRLAILNLLSCALNLKQCGSCHQEEFLVQSISQSASTYWNICYVPGTY